jgi:regulatory protein
MIISDLKKKGSDIAVIFDNGEKVFLNYKIVNDSGLHKGDFIEQSLIENLQQKSQFRKITDSAFRFLSNRAHSSYEIKRKLLKKGFDEDLIEKAVAELIERGYLNDEEFASAFTEEKSVKKKNGMQKIKAELFKRGIDRKIVEKMSLNRNEELIYENIVGLAAKKYNSLKNRVEDKIKIKTKLYSYLASKGYESDLIMKVLDLPEFKE